MLGEFDLSTVNGSIDLEESLVGVLFGDRECALREPRRLRSPPKSNMVETLRVFRLKFCCRLARLWDELPSLGELDLSMAKGSISLDESLVGPRLGDRECPLSEPRCLRSPPKSNMLERLATGV
jgi:hypothetical protein